MVINDIHQDLIAIKDLVYKPCGFHASAPVPEPESAEYGACTFHLNNLNIRFRTAKITPTKIGQFVTLWKRSASGITAPYDSSDSVDFFVISVRNTDNFGQFVFPKSVLCEKGIFSINGHGGKRGVRVYPPWDRVTSKQAQKTQEWQIKYFLEISNHVPLDSNRVKLLYSKQQ